MAKAINMKKVSNEIYLAPVKLDLVRFIEYIEFLSLNGRTSGDLARSYCRIADDNHRRKFCELLKSLGKT